MRFSPAITTHLTAGHDDVPLPPTPEKVRAVRGRLNRIAVEAKPDAAPPPDPEALRQAERRSYKRGHQDGEAAGRATAADLLLAEITRVAEALHRLQEIARGIPVAPVGSVTTLDPFHLSAPRPDQGEPVRSTAEDQDDAAMRADALIRHSAPVQKPSAKTGAAAHVPTAGAMQLLSAAVTHWPVRFTWSQIAALNGRKARGGHFNSCRKFLIDSGLVADCDGRIEPADAAFDKLGVPRKTKPRSRREILAMWMAALPSPAKDILREVAAQPGTAAIADIAGRLGLAPRGGHWNSGVSMLRINDLIRTSPAGFELGPALAEFRV